MRKAIFLLLFAIIILLLGVFKIVTYIKVKSLFPYSWDSLDRLEHCPVAKNYSTKVKKDWEYRIIHGLSFPLPVDSKIEEKFDRDGGVIKYKGNASIIITYDSKIPDLNFIKELNKDPILKEYLFKNGINNNYHLLKYSFNIKPSDISWFESNNSIISKYSFLKIKELTLGIGYENGFINFHSKEFKGFIFGDDKLYRKISANGFSNKDEQYSILTRNIKLDTVIDIIKGIKSAN